MRLLIIICCMVFTHIAHAQKKCDSLFSYIYSPFEKSQYTAGPWVVAQKHKTPASDASGNTNYLWLRKQNNRIFLYGEFRHNPSLQIFDTIPLYHGKMVFSFASGDTVSATSFPPW